MDLQGKRVALLVEDNYDDLEFWYPKLPLQEAGAAVVVVGTDSPTYRSKHDIAAEAEVMAEHAQAEAFDAFVIPMGQFSWTLCRWETTVVTPYAAPSSAYSAS